VRLEVSLDEAFSRIILEHLHDLAWLYDHGREEW